jgi:GTPase SAR1 family protein
MSAAGSAIKIRRKKNVKKGIQFCLMVCGASGTGRTTFVNTLCGRPVLEGQDDDDPTTAHIEQGVSIKPATVELELDEEGTRVSLTTPPASAMPLTTRPPLARSAPTLNASTMTFLPRRAGSSVTRVSATTVSTSCSTLFSLLVSRLEVATYSPIPAILTNISFRPRSPRA